MPRYKGGFQLTEREKASIRLAIYYPGYISPSDLYKFAYPGTLQEVEALADVPATASRWWRSKKVQDFYQAEKAIADAKKIAERERIEAEVAERFQADGASPSPSAGLDYARPENQRRKLNEIINGATDTGEALDALKIMISKQGEVAPEQIGNGGQRRVYLPLTCYDCPIKAVFADVQANYPELHKQLTTLSKHK